MPDLIINLELARRVIGYLALLHLMFPSCDIFNVVRQISLPSIRENWTGKKNELHFRSHHTDTRDWGQCVSYTKQNLESCTVV